LKSLVAADCPGWRITIKGVRFSAPACSCGGGLAHRPIDSRHMSYGCVQYVFVSSGNDCRMLNLNFIRCWTWGHNKPQCRLFLLQSLDQRFEISYRSVLSACKIQLSAALISITHIDRLVVPWNMESAEGKNEFNLYYVLYSIGL